MKQLSLATVLIACAHIGFAAEISREKVEAFIDGAVDTMMAEHSALPGVTVSVVYEGEILLLKGYGYADVEAETPVDPSRTLFRIGSITKTFTGLAVTQMVDRGLLDLDEDVNTYLRDFKIPEAFDTPITLRHLLGHRAGFEDSAVSLFEQNTEDTSALGTYLKEKMRNRVRPTGKSSTYTNYGIALAGYIVERVSGQDIASYMEENIFAPIGMYHTTLREPLGPGHPQTMRPELEALLATGYAKGADGKPVAKPQDLMLQVAPAGAISSTAEDMARYMIARMNDDRVESGRLVSAEMTAYMRERPYNDRPLILDMGYAMAEGEMDGHAYRWHNGGGSSFFSDMFMYPGLQFGVFVSTNSNDGGALTSGRIPRLVFERFFPSKLTTEPPTPPADFATRGQKFAGTYLATRRSYTTLEKLLALPQAYNVSVDADGYLVVAVGGQARKYAEIDEGVFQSAEPTVAERNRYSYLYFYEDGTGVPVRISTTTSDPIRVGFMESPSFFYTAFALALLLSMTSLAGAWRRAGRGLDMTPAGAWASRLSVAGGFAVLVAAVGLGMTLATVAGGNLDPIIFGWPPASLKTAAIASTIIVPVAIAMLALLWKAWQEPGWNTLRRVHYTAFTLALLMLANALNEWNMVGFHY